MIPPVASHVRDFYARGDATIPDVIPIGAQIETAIIALNAYCEGYPHALIPWPHRVLHAVVSVLERCRDLAAQNCATKPAIHGEPMGLLTTRSGELQSLMEVRPAEDWHEDYGPVLWHHLDEYGGVCEAPIVASGDDDLEAQQPWEGYYTHWSRLPNLPQYPNRQARLAPEQAMICDWSFTDA
jgi:hypothetical protein